MSRGGWLAAVLAAAAILCGRGAIAANIPKLAWPTDGGRVQLAFGADWDFNGCDGLRQRHAAIDIGVPKGTPVYAAAAGVVVAVGGVRQGEGLEWITLAHSDLRGRQYTTVYWHVIPAVRLGQLVGRGQQIATVEGFAGDEHLHFGVRNAPYNLVANNLALPRSRSCGTLVPRFPEAFVNPLDFTSDGKKRRTR